MIYLMKPCFKTSRLADITDDTSNNNLKVISTTYSTDENRLDYDAAVELLSSIHEDESSFDILKKYQIKKQYTYPIVGKTKNGYCIAHYD